MKSAEKPAKITEKTLYDEHFIEKFNKLAPAIQKNYAPKLSKMVKAEVQSAFYEHTEKVVKHKDGTTSTTKKFGDRFYSISEYEPFGTLSKQVEDTDPGLYTIFKGYGNTILQNLTRKSESDAIKDQKQNNLHDLYNDIDGLDMPTLQGSLAKEYTLLFIKESIAFNKAKTLRSAYTPPRT